MTCAHSSLIAGTPTSVGVPTPPRIRTGVLRPGFSFTEILFAVMVLGIGFIMIAAIFPVAIKQTQATSQETNAATIAKEAVSYLAPYSSLMWPPAHIGSKADNIVYPLSPLYTQQLWSKVSGTLILPSDSRYAWVAMYRRGYTPDLTNSTTMVDSSKNTDAQFAQIIVIAVQIHNGTRYGVGDVPNTTHANGLSTLEPRYVSATFDTTSQPNTVTIGSDAPAGSYMIGNALDSKPDHSGAVAEGSYLVVADDGTADAKKNTQVADSNSNTVTSTNGFIFRIGNARGGGIWELMPGNDTTGSATAVSTLAGKKVSCLVVGRGFDDGDGAYAGPVQDAAVYTTFVSP